jgi:hypothetical protein
MTSNMINKLLIRRITSRRTGYYSCRSSSLLQSPLSSMKISVEVRNALVDHKPIVALESTLITHGMPYPQNLQLVIPLIINVKLKWSFNWTVIF